jgi:hypothetical protein
VARGDCRSLHHALTECPHVVPPQTRRRAEHAHSVAPTCWPLDVLRLYGILWRLRSGVAASILAGFHRSLVRQVWFPLALPGASTLSLAFAAAAGPLVG